MKNERERLQESRNKLGISSLAARDPMRLKSERGRYLTIVQKNGKTLEAMRDEMP